MRRRITFSGDSDTATSHAISRIAVPKEVKFKGTVTAVAILLKLVQQIVDDNMSKPTHRRHHLCDARIQLQQRRDIISQPA